MLETIQSNNDFCEKKEWSPVNNQLNTCKTRPPSIPFQEISQPSWIGYINPENIQITWLQKGQHVEL